MANYYYGADLLPEIPVVSGKPYYFIRRNSNYYKYEVMFADAQFYFDSPSTALHTKNGANCDRYELPMGADSAWTYVDSTNGFGVESGRDCIFANADIFAGASSADVWMAGMTPELDKSGEGNFYYGTELLPKLPVIYGYPNVWIRKNSSTGRYDAIYSDASNPWYYDGDMTSVSTSRTVYWYRMFIDGGTEWTYSQATTSPFGVDANKPAIWSRYDVHSGSISATEIYLAGSEPVPEKGNDDTANILTEEQRNINNWTKNMGQFPVFNNIYSGGNNHLTYRGADGYERIYLPVEVTPDTEYEFAFDFNSPTGFVVTYSSSYEYAGVQHTLNVNTSSGFLQVGGILSEPLNASASTESTHYSITFNSQSNTTIYLIFDFGYMQDGVQVELCYNNIALYCKTVSNKYLISANNNIYTVSGGALSVVPATELTASVFEEYGADEIPASELLLPLENFSILAWNEEYVPEITAKVTALPAMQTIISDRIYLDHPSIAGIESVTVACNGELKCAVSIDGFVSWKIWNGTTWETITDNSVGMSKDTLEGITSEQWDVLIADATGMYLRVALTDETQEIEEIFIDFLQA